MVWGGGDIEDDGLLMYTVHGVQRCATACYHQCKPTYLVAMNTLCWLLAKGTPMSELDESHPHGHMGQHEVRSWHQLHSIR